MTMCCSVLCNSMVYSDLHDILLEGSRNREGSSRRHRQGGGGTGYATGVTVQVQVVSGRCGECREFVDCAMDSSGSSAEPE